MASLTMIRVDKKMTRWLQELLSYIWESFEYIAPLENGPFNWRGHISRLSWYFLSAKPRWQNKSRPCFCKRDRPLHQLHMLQTLLCIKCENDFPGVFLH